MKKEKVDESKYIQQHLANERTFLAWLRTGIAVVGIGFLAVTLHFNYGSKVSEVTDKITLLMMIFALVVGLSILVTGAISYFVKRREINETSFRSSAIMIAVATIAVSVLVLLLGVYFILVL
ncbi:YidH family protein [Bacillus sp. FJAT-27231]|uniref:YidH family protein n=1 Tax=Bacillus sp. FJAT-27231 TaxID=1679168 RepID=UPI0006714B5D|nr:DUF202 domain-containing protein [Bacillus sp. FJAT-27231]